MMTGFVDGSRDGSSNSAAQRRTPSSIYAAVVVGLAVFMACVVLAPAPISTYTAETLLRVTSTGPLTTDERIAFETDLKQWNDSLQTEFGSTIEPAIEEMSPISRIVRLTATHPHASSATTDAAEASSQLAQWLADAAQRRQLAARSALEKKASDADEKLADLQTKLDRIARQRTEHLVEATRIAALKVERSNATPAAAPEETERNRLERVVTQCRDRLAELLRFQQDEHPQVIDAKSRLQDAEAALAALPSRPRLELPKGNSETPDTSANVLGELDGQRDRLTSQIEAVETERRFWRKELEIASEREQRATLATVILGKPQVVQRQGGTPSGPRIALYLLVAIGDGVAMYLVALRSEAARRVRSIHEVQDAISLPVAAVLPANRRFDSREQKELIHYVSRATATCEGALAIAAAVLMLIGIWGQPLTVTPMEDPLGAVAEAIDRSIGSVRR